MKTILKNKKNISAEVKAEMNEQHKKILHEVSVYTNKELPASADFNIIVDGYRSHYQKMISWVETIYKAGTEKLTAAFKIQELSLNETDIENEISSTEKAKVNKKNQRDLIKLTFSWSTRRILMILAVIIFFAHVVVDQDAFRAAGFGFWASLSISIILVLSSEIIAAQIPKLISAHFGKFWQKAIIWIVLFSVVYWIYQYVGEVRLSENANATFSLDRNDIQEENILLEPGIFAALNTFFFLSICIYFPHMVPTKQQKLEKQQWDEADKEYRDLGSKLNRLKKQRLRTRSEKTTTANMSLVSSHESYALFQHAEGLFYEAVGRFKHEFMFKHGYALHNFDIEIRGLDFIHPLSAADDLNRMISHDPTTNYKENNKYGDATEEDEPLNF